MASLIKIIRQPFVLSINGKRFVPCIFSLNYSTNQKSSSLTEARGSQGEVSTTLKTVKETTKTALNLGVIIGGVSITAAVLYTVLKELFSSESPNNIFSAALDECIENQRVQDVLGTPIKGHGEEDRRGRHRRVSHQEFYHRDGKKGIKMVFYLKGSRRKATVVLEKKENDKGKYEYVYMQVIPDNMLPLSIFVVDNRQTSQSSEILGTNTPLPSLY